MRRIRVTKVVLAGVLAGVVLSGTLTGAAHAGVLVASAPACDTGATGQAFAGFGDRNYYFLVPGGSFESGAAGWSLGTAAVTSDQEPWRVNGDGGTHALAIPPAAGTVVSPTVCVGIENPSMRFFAHRSGGGLLGGASQLLVTARIETSLGTVAELPVGTITGLSNGTAWNPAPAQVVLPSLLPLLPGEHTPIQFRFTAVGTSTWVIDDVYVDPRCRG